MGEIQTPEFGSQEAKDLVVEHTEWRDLLASAEDMVAKYQENAVRYEKDALAFIADVEFKAGKQTTGESTLDRLISAQELIRQSAYNVERRIAMANGTDFNPADPEL